MRAKIIAKLFEILLGLFPAELLKGFVDQLIDLIENAVAKSENKLDDQIVLPLCVMIRSAFDIPDND